MTKCAILALCAALLPQSALSRRHNRRNANGARRHGLSDGRRYAVDLTHPLTQDMPVTDDGTPIEMISERNDDGFGARYVQWVFIYEHTESIIYPISLSILSKKQFMERQEVDNCLL